MFDWINKLVTAGRKEEAAPAAVVGTPPAQGKVVLSGVGSNSTEAPPPVSRMILLDRGGHIIGYEFVARSGMLGVRGTDPRQQQDHDHLLVKTILSMGADRIAQFRQIWLTVGEATLSAALLDGMPASATTVLVRLAGHGPVPEEVLQQLKALKAKGFRFGLAGFAGRESCIAWLPLVDVVTLDIAAYAPDELASTLELLRQKQAAIKVLARGIDSFEEYEYCLALGFDNFSGKFLIHRETWPPQPPLTPDRVRLCDLLNRLRSGAELTEISDGLKLSPELSYRFLRYINSVGMGASSHIGSLEQGALYLGREKLYRWLTLLLFSSAEGHATDGALLEQALVRGRLLELLASGKLTRVQCEELFIVGVFSLLDVLLRLPLDVAVRPLQLPEAVAQALLEGGGPYAPYLKLAKVSEDSEGSEGSEGSEMALGTGEAVSSVAALAAQLGLSINEVNRYHLEAVSWAQQLQSGQAPASP